MTITQRLGATAAALLLAGGAQAQTTNFSFSFTAPLSNGDTATGSGTLVAEAEKDMFHVTDATGSFFLYKGDDGYTIGDVSGSLFSVDDAYLMQGDDGLFTYSITFYGQGQYGGSFLNFYNNGDGTYDGGGLEIAVRGATLTFAPLDAGAVPEPASWALMIAGFGAVGYAMRRRPAARVRFA